MIPIAHRSKGFTLIELLVVMSIIATLASLAIVGIPAYMRHAEKLKCSTNLIEMHRLLMLYETDHKGMPSADGPAFLLALWGNGVDKNVKAAEIFFCPSTRRRPKEDLSNIDPAGIDYTAIDQSGKYTGRNRISSAMDNAAVTPIASNKIPDSSDPDARKNLPHSGKGFNVLMMGGQVEFFESTRFPDDLPVIGDNSPIESLRTLKPGFDG